MSSAREAVPVRAVVPVHAGSDTRYVSTGHGTTDVDACAMAAPCIATRTRNMARLEAQYQDRVPDIKSEEPRLWDAIGTGDVVSCNWCRRVERSIRGIMLPALDARTPPDESPREIACEPREDPRSEGQRQKELPARTCISPSRWNARWFDRNRFGPRGLGVSETCMIRSERQRAIRFSRCTLTFSETSTIPSGRIP